MILFAKIDEGIAGIILKNNGLECKTDSQNLYNAKFPTIWQKFGP